MTDRTDARGPVGHGRARQDAVARAASPAPSAPPAPDRTPAGRALAIPVASPAGQADAGVPAAIVLEDISAGYGDRLALEHVALRVPAGTLLAVVGPNGAGKSTLLKVMAGLLEPWSGRATVLGERPGGGARRIAYVPQAELVDWQFPVTVEDVVMMGRYPRLGLVRRPGAADRAAVAEALDLVGMRPQRLTQIGSLSGGQRRRVFLARALAAEPDLFLLDEPVTGVDATTQEDLMDILEEQTRHGKTVVATTHDLACAAQRFQAVAGINRTLIATGPSSLVLEPDVLARIYGGHLLVVGGQTYLMDDAHHHDEAMGGERHYHEEREDHGHGHEHSHGAERRSGGDRRRSGGAAAGGSPDATASADGDRHHHPEQQP